MVVIVSSCVDIGEASASHLMLPYARRSPSPLVPFDPANLTMSDRDTSE